MADEPPAPALLHLVHQVLHDLQAGVAPDGSDPRREMITWAQGALRQERVEDVARVLMDLTDPKTATRLRAALDALLCDDPAHGQAD